MKTSAHCQIVALFQEIGVAKFNGDARMLIGNSEIAVCAHAQYKFGQNSPEQLARRRAAFKWRCISTCHVI